jgi:hypothetical protein
VYPASLPASQRTLSIYGYGASGPYNPAALARKGALGLDYWSNDISLRGSPSQACYGDTGAPIVIPSELPGSANKVVGILRDPGFYDKQAVCSASSTLHSATRIDMMIDWIRSTITQNSPNTCQDLVDSQGRTFTRCYDMPSCAPLTTSSWTGCQGSGCSACTSQLSQYPNYFRNHPNCTRNTACSGATSYCSANCPPPSNADKGCSNQIPLGRSSATASSSVNGNTPARAIDGYNTTRWESAAADPQSITVDLGQDRWVNKVILDWETASAAYYEIELSTDGTTWTRGAIYPNSTKMNHRIDTLNVTPGVARYVRMRGTSRTTTWGYSLWDFAVYGDSNPQCNP